MSNQDDPSGEFEAVDAMLGGFPPGFEKESEAYQLAWLRRRIPELKQEITQLETQATTHIAGANALMSDASKAAAVFRRKQEARLAGVPFTPSPNVPKSGFGNFLGGLFQAAAGLTSTSMLKGKKDILAEMEIRERILRKKPAPASQPAKPTGPQQRAQKLAEAASLEAERDKVAPTISDPTFRHAYVNSMNDKIQKIYDSI